MKSVYCKGANISGTGAQETQVREDSILPTYKTHKATKNFQRPSYSPHSLGQ